MQGNRCVVVSAGQTGVHIRDIPSGQHGELNWPVAFENLAAHIEYQPFKVNDQMEPGEMEIAGFQVQAAENRHRGGSLTFRIQYGPHIVVYSTDHEAGDPEIDSRLVELAQGAHLWILDVQYTIEERQRLSGWGHSSYLEAVQLALEAGVEIVVPFHHHPNHDDNVLDQMGLEAAELSAGTQTKVLMARDGMVIDVKGTPPNSKRVRAVL